MISKKGSEHKLAFSQQNDYSMLFAKDIDGMEKYGLKAVPSTLFIDAKGTVVDKHTGGMSGAQLRNALDKIKQ